MAVTKIETVAVIGSGVMGAQIAAHIANSGTKVLLFDRVLPDAKDRNQLPKDAIKKLLEADPEPLTDKSKAKLMTPLNLEDNLEQLSSADWIIEAVIEDVRIKKDLYKQIDEVRKIDSIVSSNTSTIPLATLTNKMPANFKKDFIITHFFNPPRYMMLLELVYSDKNTKRVKQLIEDFADNKLGKTPVICNDTPGFIANRIGCFWLTSAVNEALEMKISVEDADAVLSKPIGVPKTGVFGLLDLIGLDLMPLIAKAFKETLPADDEFNKIYHEPEIIRQMINDGYTGRKGKGGFYRLNKDGGGKVKEAKNLLSGAYNKAKESDLDSVKLAKDSLVKMLEFDDIGGKYAYNVMVKTLAYTASLVPEMAADIVDVDTAMKLGYNWKYGPFELIDKLSDGKISGAAWLKKQLKAKKIAVPKIIENAGNNSFYKIEDNNQVYLNLEGKYIAKKSTQDKWFLSDKKIGKKEILKNPSAVLWDLGDGIACLEYKSKMNSVDPFVLEMIAKATEKVKQDFKGLVIGNDAENFCVGANIGVLLFAANVAAWKQIEEIIKQGQDAYMGLKYAPFPVVTAVSGLALGGGCEVLLHSDAVVAHIETYTGLVEVGVGVIPGWGGCKEILRRQIAKRLNDQRAVAKLGRMFSMMSPIKTLNTMPAVTAAFEQIALAKVAKSAHQAQKMLILGEHDVIVMNRHRLLSQAKQTCIDLVKDYKAPNAPTFNLPGKTARVAINMAIRGFVKSGKATAHDATISSVLAQVLSGGKCSIKDNLTEQNILDLEREAFMELIKMTPTLDRIEHMLNTGKPLRN